MPTANTAKIAKTRAANATYQCAVAGGEVIKDTTQTVTAMAQSAASSAGGGIATGTRVVASTLAGGAVMASTAAQSAVSSAASTTAHAVYEANQELFAALGIWGEPNRGGLTGAWSKLESPPGATHLERLRDAALRCMLRFHNTLWLFAFLGSIGFAVFIIGIVVSFLGVALGADLGGFTAFQSQCNLSRFNKSEVLFEGDSCDAMGSGADAPPTPPRSPARTAPGTPARTPPAPLPVLPSHTPRTLAASSPVPCPQASPTAHHLSRCEGPPRWRACRGGLHLNLLHGRAVVAQHLGQVPHILLHLHQRTAHLLDALHCLPCLLPAGDARGDRARRREARGV